MTLTVVVPTRGRPENARRLAKAFHETCTANTKLVFVHDSSDAEDRWRYTVALRLLHSFNRTWVNLWRYPGPHNTGFVKPLNWGVLGVLGALNWGASVSAVGFLGDDHLPRTVGWDSLVLDALKDHRFVFGDDLHQGPGLSTHVFAQADAVRRLGWLAPPTFEHLYADNTWMDLGAHYLPGVVIEHLHPIAGKSTWDAHYESANQEERRLRDAAEYERWKREDLAGCLERLKS